MDKTFRQRLIELLWEHNIPHHLGQGESARFLDALLRMICLRDGKVIHDFVAHATSARCDVRSRRRTPSEN